MFFMSKQEAIEETRARLDKLNNVIPDKLAESIAHFKEVTYYSNVLLFLTEEHFRE